MVNKIIFSAVFIRDEVKTLFVIEPLDCTLCLVFEFGARPEGPPPPGKDRDEKPRKEHTGFQFEQARIQFFLNELFRVIIATAGGNTTDRTAEDIEELVLLRGK